MSNSNSLRVTGWIKLARLSEAVILKGTYLVLLKKHNIFTSTICSWVNKQEPKQEFNCGEMERNSERSLLKGNYER